MPKLRGPELDDALEELEQEKWETDSGEWFIDDYLNPPALVAADYVADDKGNVKSNTTDQVVFANDCDQVDPRIWPLMMKWLSKMKVDESEEDDLPFLV